MSEVAELYEEEEQADEIRIAFDGAIQAESDEDDVKMAMIGAGATFKNVTRFYNQYMIDAGMAISKADRSQIVDDTLEGTDFDTEELFELAVGNLVDAIQGSTERSAAALIRSYAKKNEMECYIKPKGEGGQRNSFVHRYYNWLAENPAATEEAANDFIFGNGDYDETSLNVKNYHKMHQNVRVLCNRIAAK